MQPQRGVLARGQHHPQLRGQLRQEKLEPLQRFSGAQLVQIVDHQHDRLLERVQVGPQPLDDREAAERRRGLDPLHERVRADNTGERVDDRQPEALRIALPAFHRDPDDPIGRPRRLDPGSQQHGLAAPRGRAHEDHLARANSRQPVEESSPRYSGQPLGAGAVHVAYSITQSV